MYLSSILIRIDRPTLIYDPINISKQGQLYCIRVWACVQFYTSV